MEQWPMPVETRTTRLASDERYPFLHESEIGPAVEVPQDQLDRWRDVMSMFERVQVEMESAYDAAVHKAREVARIEKAEAGVAAAQRRLARERWAQANRPDSPASWRYIGDGELPCGGIQYVDEKDARAERLRLHNEWPGITFDLKPYVCVQGHHHLGRSSEVQP